MKRLAAGKDEPRVATAAGHPQILVTRRPRAE
jgi:hypothetical protein